MKIKAVFFDLFATIIFPPTKKESEEFLIENDIPFPEKYKELTGFPFAYFTEILDIDFNLLISKYLVETYESVDDMLCQLSKLSKKELTGEIIYKTKLLIDFHNNRCTVVDGICKLFTRLKEKSLKLILISNLQYPFKNVIYNNNLDKWFDLIILSFETGCRKPDRRIFDIGLDMFNLKAGETIMIGDNFKSDIYASHLIGMKPIWIQLEEPHFKEDTSRLMIKPVKTIEELNIAIEKYLE